MPTIQPYDNQAISNALNNIMQWESNRDRQEQNNALLQWKNRPAAVERDNALARKAKLDEAMSQLQYARETLKNVDVDQFGAEDYEGWLQTMNEINPNITTRMPDVETFIKQDEAGNAYFDRDSFKKFQTNTISKVDDVVKNGVEKSKYKEYKLNLPNGKQIVHFHDTSNGEAFDPETVYPGATFDGADKQEGKIRSYKSGGEEITEEYAGGKWQRKASSPKWKDGEGGSYGGGGSAAKVGTVNQVEKILAARYLPIAKANLGKSEATQLAQGLFTTDQFGGSVNTARLYDALQPHQRAAYDRIRSKAEGYAAKYGPSKAVDMALQEFEKEGGGKTGGSGKKDRYGYTVGQTVTKGGSTYKYVGNDKWKRQ